jgi:hypothetical protein
MHDRAIQFLMTSHTGTVATGAFIASGMCVAMTRDAIGLRRGTCVAAGAPGGDEFRIAAGVTAHALRIREFSGRRLFTRYDECR